MAELKTQIRLRTDTEANFNAVATTCTPLQGEVCIITTSAGTRIKIGDGTTTIGSLPYYDADNSFKLPVVLGYYYNSKFYKEAAHTTAYTLYNHQVYYDLSTKYIYIYNGSALVRESYETGNATTAGIVKLYTASGSNTDGTMTQKAVTDLVNGVKFSVSNGVLSIVK